MHHASAHMISLNAQNKPVIYADVEMEAQEREVTCPTEVTELRSDRRTGFPPCLTPPVLPEREKSQSNKLVKVGKVGDFPTYRLVNGDSES